MTQGNRIDVSRKACPSPHRLANKIGRTVWGLAWALTFRPSPRIGHAWRRWILRCFGAQLGRGVKVMPSVRIWAPWNLVMGDWSSLGPSVDCYNVAPVRIGAHATVSRMAQLCTAGHDVTDPHMALQMKPITVGDGAWVCQGAYLGPGVELGEGAVAAAHAVVVKKVESWTIVGGNPAEFIQRRNVSA